MGLDSPLFAEDEIQVEILKGIASNAFVKNIDDVKQKIFTESIDVFLLSDFVVFINDHVK